MTLLRLACLIGLVLDAGAAEAQQIGRANSPESRVARAVDPRVFHSHLEFLADDALEGRAPGTRGGTTAAKYIATQFERLGLVPAGDTGSYFQRVPIIRLTPQPSLAVGAAQPAALAWKKDFVMWSMRNDSLVSLRAEPVFVGYGIVAPEYGWNDYAGVNVKGKLVITLTNDPGLRDSTIFRGKILTYYGRWTYKIEEARRQGAAGILMIHTTESATYPWTTVLSSWSGPQVRLETEPSSLIVAGWLQQDAAGRLFSQGGQDLTSLSERAWHRGFRPVPLKVQLDASVRSGIRRSDTYNVLGRLPGRGPLAREAVLIGGHYDHFGIGVPVDGDSIYNGAEDNASGTAAVLAAAEAFVRSSVRAARSMLFIGFAAEESGLLGSQALATTPPIPLRDMAAILNMDVMNLYGRTRDFSALGLDQSTLGETVTRAAAAEGLRVSTNEDALIRGAYFRSDHFSLARVGVPGTSLESGTDYVGRPAGWGKQQQDEYVAKRYHQPSDELLPWFTDDGAVQQLRVIVRTAVAVGNEPSQPTWKANSEFRQAGEERTARK
ncbi:MAG TPA: M28 family peptidase [Gemmatimonadales bacterium]|jgi:Zn-dependent M28 family amino/carboxypeptidase|nr:M28 family peptidase [Gemmatimonadales bacterium]